MPEADAAAFDIDPSTGQLITKAPLDEETKSPSYTVTVTVDRRRDARDSHLIDADRDDHGHGRDEPTGRAGHPPTVVSGADDSTDARSNRRITTSLKVVWHDA